MSNAGFIEDTIAMYIFVYIIGKLLIFYGGSWKGLCGYGDKSWNTNLASVCIYFTNLLHANIILHMRNKLYYYYITKYTKKNRNLIGCSLINIGHIIPNIGFTAVPGGPIIFDIGQHVNIELLI